MRQKNFNYKTFLENIDGMVIVDEEGTILVMEDKLAKACFVDGVPLDKNTAVGKNIMDVIPTTNIMKCFDSRESQVADYYFVEGRTIVSTRKPIIVNGKISYAMEFDLFGIDGEFLADFLTKTNMISKNLQQHISKLQPASSTKYTINTIIGNSPKMLRLKEEIQIASRYNSTVLIEGETGSGKELVAHSIHALSDRQLAPFIKINCAAIPENLVESELFGYTEGSFTGSQKGGKKGKLELANGGTIFLDEINQMPLFAQPKLLRALQEHEVNPIGSEKNIPIDVRVIATSNEDLKKMVQEGRFREDLYYRLNVMNIKVPPLAERKEDISDIVNALIQRLNRPLGKSITGISQRAIHLLKGYHWPGNVRELNNVIERAMNHCQGDLLKTIHFNDDFLQTYASETMSDEESAEETLEQVRDRAERKAIIDALINCHGNKAKAARSLGISRSLIHKKINKFLITEKEYF